ncbi:hypothetical protein T440DRAFT_523468 [Plenodomus tracheiphilus IPT5]|uniref:Protein kinase domain-containing protein n=1 Tax=Plenodomus tracheiphilus IPT5 TaxID=1408161 RepID=A0A6A7AQP7_9PLEO|nr:hypothetical protein T440DRAFT_523468 [Plenodomus tracheiphilus IPT5]
MTSRAIEQAFQRHPRPQGVPTKAALLERALRKEQRASTLNRGLRESPWKSLVRQGELTQGKHVWTICFQQSKLAMVKETSCEAGQEEFRKVSKLSDHPHVATIKEAFQTDTSWFFQFEYARITLEEVLSVHTRLEEKHIQVISSSIFLAVKHVSNTGIVHTAISTETIRLCSNGKPLLSNFENSVWSTTEQTSNTDLESLGVVVLECMNGSPNERLRDSKQVRRLRESNKTFGLENGENWSDQKLLVDFLDQMFNDSMPAIAKLDKPHRYLTREPAFSILVPFLELVPLECFALWRPAAIT